MLQSIEDSTICAVNLFSNLTTAYLSIPSSIMENQHSYSTVNSSALTIFQTHYIINAFLFLFTVGFLSWSLDAHGPDDVPKDYQRAIVQNNHSKKDERQIRAAAPKNIVERPSSSGRRRTIEDIATLLAQEDAARRHRHSLRLSSAAASPAAQDIGIEGADVMWSIPSIEDVFILPLPTATVVVAAADKVTEQPAAVVKDVMLKVEREEGKDQAVVQEMEMNGVEDVVKRAEKRSRSWKTRTLVKLRVPVQWVL